ncbi:MAG: hypothetical protein LUG19_03765 [Desulfovibrio sp.]|nr:MULTISPECIES: hypothetical protein [Desulfovibrio]MCD7983356.1 hypothetical protein [Desulfovibrio sp.]MDY3808642.1 hypothetical protein [Desulfovibrio porci]
MARFWRRFRFFWHEFRKRRKYGAAIRPEGIRSQAEELGHLAELAGRSVPLAGLEARHLAELAQAMAHLVEMTRTADFCRLSADRRLALHDNLREAREKLLASVQKAGLASEKPQ